MNYLSQHPTVKEARALQHLSSTNEFQTFLGYLQRSLEERDQDNRHLDTPHLYRSQGAAGVLDEILTTAANAQQIAQRMQAPR